MKKLNKAIYLAVCVAMLSSSLGVSSFAKMVDLSNIEVIKAESSFVPLNQNNENEEITLSPFMVLGMKSGTLQNVPERIQEQINDSDVDNIPEIKITRKEASQITGKLYTDDLMPIMYTGYELQKYVLVGVDQLMYFTNIDIANIFGYAFSKEQLNALVPNTLKYFMSESVEDIKKALPHIDLNILLSPHHSLGLIVEPHWDGFKNLAAQALDKAEKEMKTKVNNANIAKEEKDKLLKYIDDVTEKQKAKWASQSIYYINDDLRNMVYTPNNLYKVAWTELEELTKKKIQIKVDNKQGDKKDESKNINTQDSLKFNTNKSYSNSDNNAVYRLHGQNKYETAISVSQNAFKSADTVVLVNPLKPSDCLTSSVYAKLIGAPLLFTDTDKLPNETLKELERLNAKNVIIVGGIRSINNGVIPSKFNVERVFGMDRYETSVEVANDLNKKLNIKADSFVLASGETFTDALAATPKAIKEKAPILLTGSNKLDNHVLSKIKEDAKSVAIIGGVNTVNQSVRDDVKKYVKDTSVFEGKDRYETAINIAKSTNPDATKAVIVNSHSVSDALVSSYVDSDTTPILLTDSDELTSSTKEYIKMSKIRKETIVGGVKSVSDNVLKQLENLFK